MAEKYDKEQREHLLDTFPLSEYELDRLLRLFDCSCLNEDHDSEPSLSQILVAAQQGDEQRKLNMDSDSEENTWISALQRVEEAMLPEASQVLHQTRKSSSVLICYTENDTTSHFLEAAVSLVGRRGARILTDSIYDATIFKSASGTADASSLISLSYRLLIATLYLRGSTNSTPPIDPPKAWISSLQNSSSVDENAVDNISRSQWANWVTWTAPEIIRGLSTFFHYAIFSPNHPFRSNAVQPFAPPQPDKETLFWTRDTDLLSLSLGCLPGSVGGKLYCLYSSGDDGLSFLTFQNSLLSYSGATMMLIRTKGNALFGFYTDCPWQSGTSWFGGDGFDSFLFRLDPSLNVYNPSHEGKCYTYLNSAASVANNSLRGLAIGGIAEDMPRVHIPISLENCKASPVDTAYASGPLLGSDEEPFFEVDAIEVWAVNVSEKEFATKRQSGQMRATAREEARVRAAQVDRSAFVSDFQSGAYMNRLYEHREQARGRHDFVVAGAHQGYYVEGKQPSRRNILAPNDSDAELSEHSNASSERGETS